MQNELYAVREQQNKIDTTVQQNSKGHESLNKTLINVKENIVNILSKSNKIHNNMMDKISDNSKQNDIASHRID